MVDLRRRDTLRRSAGRVQGRRCGFPQLIVSNQTASVDGAAQAVAWIDAGKALANTASSLTRQHRSPIPSPSFPGDITSRSPSCTGIAPHQRVAPVGAFGV